MEYTPNTYIQKTAVFATNVRSQMTSLVLLCKIDIYTHSMHTNICIHAHKYVSDGCKGRKKNLILQNCLWLKVTSMLSRCVEQ